MPRSILLTHALWHIRGGAERMTYGIRAVLESHGHEVIPFGTRHPDDPELPNQDLFPRYREMGTPRLSRESLEAAGGLIYSPRARRAISALLDRGMPDIAHMRTVAHHLSPSVLLELADRDVPVLMHLPDYKLICPNYKMFVGASVCSRCVGGHFYHAVSQRCMKDSYSASALVALEGYVHRFMRVYERSVDLFVTPSRFQADVLVAGGLPADRIRVLPNFTDLEFWAYAPPSAISAEPYFVYSGRLSFEKGVAALVRAAARNPDVGLRIAGDGPERQVLEQLARELGAANIRFLGWQQPEQLRTLLAGSRGLVIPSEWHETFGITILEAFSVGRPVIGTRRGGIPDLVVDGVTGLLVPAGDTEALSSAITSLAADADGVARMGLEARQRVETRFSPEAYYRGLMQLYGETVELHRARRSHMSWTSRG